MRRALALGLVWGALGCNPSGFPSLGQPLDPVSTLTGSTHVTWIGPTSSTGVQWITFIPSTDPPRYTWMQQDGLGLGLELGDYTWDAASGELTVRAGTSFVLPDETGPEPFVAGTIGLARGAPDTAGAQWFITMSRAPQLDGQYTRIGEVVSGLEVVTRLTTHDRVIRVRRDGREADAP